MKLLAFAIVALLTLSACASSETARVAREAAQRPILLSYSFASFQRGDSTTRPADYPSSNDGQPDLVGDALVKAGYARVFYRLSPLGDYPARLVELTDAGKAQRWACKSDGSCEIAVGTMEIGAAKTVQIWGDKYVEFYCTAVPNAVGKAFGSDGLGNLTTSWSNPMDSSVEFGHRGICYLPLGPDGALQW